MAESNDDREREFNSKLKTGRERFLAHAVEHAIEIELRSAEDFIRHFPPADLMMGLKDEPGLRAQVLVLTTGIKHKIAVKKTAESAGEDLQIALDEGETDAESIVALFNPDDRVRFLDQNKLWWFCIEDEFWNTTSSNKTEHERAKNQIAFMLARALEDRLVNHQEVVEGIGVAELATRLPRSELSKVIEQALTNSHKKTAFTEKDLLSALPPDEIVKHVPLPHIWELVLGPVAVKHGYEKKSSEEVAKAVDFLGKDGEGANETHDEKASNEAASGEAERPASGETGWTVPPESDAEITEGDVEITDDDIRIS